MFMWQNEHFGFGGADLKVRRIDIWPMQSLPREKPLWLDRAHACLDAAKRFSTS